MNCSKSMVAPLVLGAFLFLAACDGSSSASAENDNLSQTAPTSSSGVILSTSSSSRQTPQSTESNEACRLLLRGSRRLLRLHRPAKRKRKIIANTVQ